MSEARLSSKGQVVLPKQVRDARGWTAGTRFIVEETPEGILLRPAHRPTMADWDKLIGALADSGEPMAIEEMDEAVAKAVRRRRAGGRY